ncbi:hypothetical protein EDD18DRAFT_1401920 [Armillaria luteobubalina]|uniref:Uncharacterized protein n=1 Tax=Armillaria luteobubalina TaxID=153913 RepID=A0AA39Q272_9AGAR|nr:hypothetical protein EDD18DRAFT_1401920 [Armillaria luteobubalina]
MWMAAILATQQIQASPTLKDLIKHLNVLLVTVVETATTLTNSGAPILEASATLLKDAIQSFTSILPSPLATKKTSARQQHLVWLWGQSQVRARASTVTMGQGQGQQLEEVQVELADINNDAVDAQEITSWLHSGGNSGTDMIIDKDNIPKDSNKPDGDAVNADGMLKPKISDVVDTQTEGAESEGEELDKGEKRYWKSSRSLLDGCVMLRLQTYARMINGITKAGNYCHLCRQCFNIVPAYYLHFKDVSNTHHVDFRTPKHYKMYLQLCEEHKIKPKAKAPKGWEENNGKYIRKQANISEFTIVKLAPPPPFTKAGLAEYVTEFLVDCDLSFRISQCPSFHHLLKYMQPKTMAQDIPQCTMISDNITRKTDILDQIDSTTIKSPMIAGQQNDNVLSLPSPSTTFKLMPMNAPNGCLNHSFWSSRGQRDDTQARQWGKSCYMWWTNIAGMNRSFFSSDSFRLGDPKKLKYNPVEMRGRCIEHGIHLMGGHFIIALQIPTIMKTKRHLHQQPDNNLQDIEDIHSDFVTMEVDVSLDVEAGPKDVDAIVAATSVEFEPSDVVGKILAFIMQVHSGGSKLAEEYLLHLYLSAEKTPTCQHVYPILERLQSQWEGLFEDPTFEPVHPALEAGLKNLRKWYHATEHTSIYFIYISDASFVVLDLGHKLTYLRVAWQDDSIKKSMKRMSEIFLKYKEQATRPMAPTSHSSDNTITQALKSQGSTSTEDWMEEIIHQRAPMPDPTPESATAELDEYMYSKPVNHTLCEDIITCYIKTNILYYLPWLATISLYQVHQHPQSMLSLMLDALTLTLVIHLKAAYRDGRLTAQDEIWMSIGPFFDDDVETTKIYGLTLAWPDPPSPEPGGEGLRRPPAPDHPSSAPQQKPTYAAITRQRMKHPRIHAPQPAGQNHSNKMRAPCIAANFAIDLPTEHPLEYHVCTALNTHFTNKNHEQEFLHAQFAANGRNMDEFLVSRWQCESLKSILQEILGLDSTHISVHCDKPWLKLIIGQIPCQDINPTDSPMENITTELLTYNSDLGMHTAMSSSVPQAAIMHFLTPGGELKGDETHASLCITLDDEACAH